MTDSSHPSSCVRKFIVRLDNEMDEMITICGKVKEHCAEGELNQHHDLYHCIDEEKLSDVIEQLTIATCPE